MKGPFKSLLYFLVTIILFGVFIYILLRPSTQSKAIKEIEKCFAIADVKATWDKYRTDLSDDEDYCQAVREKLKTLNLTEETFSEVKKWLPSRTQNLNIILVPDLSKRISDEKNNPDQIQNDTALLKSIYAQFEKKVRLKMNSKDRLIVDIADPRQGQGQFRTVANDLIFDLSDHKGKSNRLYFNSVKGVFESKIDQLYRIAAEKQTGADYVYFFSQKLQTLIKKSTIEDDFRNVLVLITDGYLEITLKDGSKCSISPDESLLKKYYSTGNSSSFKYPNQTSGLFFPDVEVYLFEVHERQNGMGRDLVGLKKWWTDWFQMMNIKNVQTGFIFKRQSAIDLTKKEIQDILTN